MLKLNPQKLLVLKTVELLSLTLILTVFFQPLLVIGQTLDEIDNSDSLALEANPRWPKPNQTVKLHLSGYGFPLDQSIVSWYVNKQRVQSETGLRNFSFQVGDLGKPSLVTVVVTPPTSNQITKQINFVPASVDFLIQADSYTPLGYKGAALPGPYTKVKVVAMANIKNGDSYIPADRINFTWEQDGQIQTSQSGVGKDYFLLTTKGHPYSTSLKLTARSINTNITATNNITVSTVAPDIILYPYLPLSGVKLEALNNSLNGNGEVAIKVEPYYLDNRSVKTGSFLYNFSVNNKPIVNRDSLGGLLHLIINRDSDLANIKLTISNLADQLQQYQKTFNLKVSTDVFSQ